MLHDVDASGGYQASARYIPSRGAVRVSAGGALTISGTVDVSHGDCAACLIALNTGGDLALDHLDAHATGTGTDGGQIDLEARGSITLDGTISAQGSGGDPDTGGIGGSVTVDAGQDLLVNGSMVLRGTAPDGDGGVADLEAGRDLVQGAGAVIDTDGGGSGCGGSDNSFVAGRDLRLGTVTAVGASCGAGAVDASADRDVSVSDVLVLSSSGDGEAGDISMQAGRTLTVAATMRANGGSAGKGGSVDLESCRIDVVAGVSILTNGPHGANTLLAHDTMTIGGRLEAGAFNKLRYGDPEAAPVITGVIIPDTTPIYDAALDACSTPAVCGDGVLEGREECEDGNTFACDGCSAACTREGCGNHRIDCDETCDPPDGYACDARCRVIQRPIQRFAGGFRTTGCQAEWELSLAAPAIIERTGLPKRTQPCIDGDPGCDLDGANDGACTVPARICLRANDPRLPLCVPPPINQVSVRAPKPLDPADATDDANAAALVEGLRALGVTVVAGSTVLAAGTPDATIDHCTAPLALRVPHSQRTGTRTFSIGAADVSGRRLKSNAMKIACLPNDAVCGDGTIGIGEVCDDGNLQGCDGCSPTCRVEACGNGVIDCGEDCDEGSANGQPGSGCTATCTVPPPSLRIAAGRSRYDCGLEFALTLDPSRVAPDAHGLPASRQACVDGDPACDLDPRPGHCRLQLFLCTGGADSRLGCSAAGIDSVSVLRPAVPGDPTREGLLGAAAGLGLPRGPGEACSVGVPIDLDASSKTTLRLRAVLASGRKDSDTLKLACLPAP